MPLSNELNLCGLPAVQARFARDPESIRRLFFDEPTSRKLGAQCKALAAAKKVYRCVTPAELEKISGTMHHGGVVCVVAASVIGAPLAKDIAAWAAAQEPVLVLDRIGNPHNLGAIARSGAFFGVQHIVIPTHPSAALPGEAAHRVAEGGLEHIRVWRVPALPAFLGALAAAGYAVIGASTRGGSPLGAGRAAATKPVALVLGNEEQGLAPEVAKACSGLVTLAGSGKVESLNVSVAAAVLLHSLLGRRPGA
jgi:RNA methyltransferase, TrmH family